MNFYPFYQKGLGGHIFFDERRNPQIFRLYVMCGSTIDSYGQKFKRGTKFDHWAILPGTQDVLHALVTMELTSC